MKPGAIDQIREEIVSDPFFGEAVGFILERLGDVRNKAIFDSGCGSGTMSVFFALQGSRVTGIDIDGAKIDQATHLANTFGVEDRCLFVQGSSESTGIEAGSIDIVFSESTIQYMERATAIHEYLRILKPDGSLALVENLPYNPLINLYRLRRRLFTRTQAERDYVRSIRGYLNFHDIHWLGNHFRSVESRHYHLLRMLSIYPRERFRNSSLAERLDRLVSRIDTTALRVFPFLGYFAWFTALYCSGRRSAGSVGP